MKISSKKWFKSWGLGIVIASFVSVLAVLWLMRSEPMPVPNQPDLPDGVLPPGVQSAKLHRTDTIDQERMICLLNATTKDLMTVYLQTWNISPPRKISTASHRIWAFTEAPAQDMLQWIASMFGYSISADNDPIKLQVDPSGNSKFFEPHQTNCPPVQLTEGKLGDRLWNAMRDADLHFFAVLPSNTSNAEITKQSLSSLLKAYDIHIAKQDNSYIFWTPTND